MQAFVLTIFVIRIRIYTNVPDQIASTVYDLRYEEEKNKCDEKQICLWCQIDEGFILKSIGTVVWLRLHLFTLFCIFSGSAVNYAACFTTINFTRFLLVTPFTHSIIRM